MCTLISYFWTNSIFTLAVPVTFHCCDEMWPKDLVLAYASKGIEVIMVGMARQQGAKAKRWIIILLWHTRKWGTKWKWGKAVNLKAHPHRHMSFNKVPCPKGSTTILHSSTIQGKHFPTHEFMGAISHSNHHRGWISRSNLRSQNN